MYRFEVFFDFGVESISFQGNDFRSGIGIVGDGRVVFRVKEMVDDVVGVVFGVRVGFDRVVDGEFVFRYDSDKGCNFVSFIRIWMSNGFGNFGWWVYSKCCYFGVGSCCSGCSQ